MRLAIYHVLICDYDNFQEPKHIQKDADYYLFTDQEIESDLYIIKNVEAGDNPILTARQWKIVKGYAMLCGYGYDLIVYHDCNIVQIKDLSRIIALQICDLMILKHPIRNCIYEEFHACFDGRKDNAKTMHKQIQRYANDFYPKNNGLVASGLMFRRNSKQVLRFCKAWLNEVENGSIRDQLSFNYVSWKKKYKFDLLDWQYLYDYFTYNSKHKRR